MAKIKFNIRYRPQIESGEYKVETRDGRPARIICWDRKSESGGSIFALVYDGDSELGYSFRNTGRFLTSSEDTLDLFIITPEPELTEFECGMLRYLQDGANCKDDAEIVKETKKHSEYLLRYARKEIESEAKQEPRHTNPHKRLPTIEEWKLLISNCKWKWDKEHKGQVVTAKNGNSIFLPAAGYRSDNYLHNVGSNGRYWSSSPYMDYPGFAYGVYFYPSNVTCGDDARYYGFSVRPVSDTPQEGFVDMGNNLFWAEKNVEGHFTYDEAMELFNP